MYYLNIYKMTKLVKSNLPRSKFPFIWGEEGEGEKGGGGQSWSSQICLDLNFPLFGGRGVSKLVKSNLPRSKFPFIWGEGEGGKGEGVKVGQVKSA